MVLDLCICLSWLRWHNAFTAESNTVNKRLEAMVYINGFLTNTQLFTLQNIDCIGVCVDYLWIIMVF